MDESARLFVVENEPAERARFGESARTFYRRQMKIASYNALVGPVVETLGIAMVIVASVMGGYLDRPDATAEALRDGIGELFEFQVPTEDAIYRHEIQLLAYGNQDVERWGTPEDVGRAVRAIAEDRFPFSTGAVFDLSGGRATY